MSNKRNSYSAEFKAKIAILALSETMTIWEICSKFELHGTQVCKRKKDLQIRSKEIFERPNKKDDTFVDKEKEMDQLYKQVWKLTVENDWLKKKSSLFPI
jgi:putative transposase